MRRNRLLTKIRNYIPNCVICGIPKIQRNEDNDHFLKRKTCGKDTDCYRKYMSGKGNPNYKGYMPKCVICGKRLSYKSAEENKIGKKYRYCLFHAKQSYKNGEYHDALAKRNKERIKNAILQSRKEWIEKVKGMKRKYPSNEEELKESLLSVVKGTDMDDYNQAITDICSLLEETGGGK